jgi:hypothetical protein
MHFVSMVSDHDALVTLQPPKFPRWATRYWAEFREDERSVLALFNLYIEGLLTHRDLLVAAGTLQVRPLHIHSHVLSRGGDVPLPSKSFLYGRQKLCVWLKRPSPVRCHETVAVSE